MRKCMQACPTPEDVDAAVPTLQGLADNWAQVFALSANPITKWWIRSTLTRDVAVAVLGLEI